MQFLIIDTFALQVVCICSLFYCHKRDHSRQHTFIFTSLWVGVQTQLGLAGSSVLGLTRLKSRCLPAVVPSDAQGPLWTQWLLAKFHSFSSASHVAPFSPSSNQHQQVQYHLYQYQYHSPTSLSHQLEKILCSWALLWWHWADLDNPGYFLQFQGQLISNLDNICKNFAVYNALICG